jgi:hypothetical protein
LERESGLEISRVTLCGWVMAVGELLMPISGAMRQELLSGDYIQADETPVGVQSERTKGKNHQAYLWKYGQPLGPVVFDFQLDSSGQGPRRFLVQPFKAWASVSDDNWIEESTHRQKGLIKTRTPLLA